MLLIRIRAPGFFWPSAGEHGPLRVQERPRSSGLLFIPPTSPPQFPLSSVQPPQTEDPQTSPSGPARLPAPQFRGPNLAWEKQGSAKNPQAAGQRLGGLGPLAPRPRAPPPPAGPPLPAPPRPLPRTSRPARPPPALRPPPSALLPLAVREVLRLSRCHRRRSRPLFRVSAAATAGGIRGSLTGLAPRYSRRFSLPPAAAAGRSSPAAEPLGASVLALLPPPRVLEKRPRPGNGASRFQR